MLNLPPSESSWNNAGGTTAVFVAAELVQLIIMIFNNIIQIFILL